MTTRSLTTIATLSLLLTACQSFQNQIDDMVYRPDVVQGDVMDKDAVRQVYKGMSRQAVIGLLGKPVMTQDTDSNTLTYVYYHAPHHEPTYTHVLKLTFKDNKLVKIDNRKSTSDKAS